MTKIANCIVLAGAVLFATIGCSTVNKSASGKSASGKSAAGPLEGKWSGREPGADPETPRTMVISGTTFDYHGADPKDWAKGTITYLANTQPRQFDVHLAECGYPEYTGKTAHVIYKFEGDTLTVASAEPGEPAPASFDTPNHRLMLFKKASRASN
jgi:uncharacterized protein (TIGR03067 family)